MTGARTAAGAVAADRDGQAVGVFAVLALAATALAPGLSGVAVEVAVLAVLGLSIDLVLRRLGALALFQPAAVALSVWLTAALLARNQSPVIALAAAALAGAGCGLAALAGHAAGRAGLAVAGMAVALGVTAVTPTGGLFVPPVFLGVSLGTPRAALVVALLTLAAAAWMARALRGEDLTRWLAVARDTPDLVSRAGVSLAAVRGAGLALAGALAGLAGWAAALASLGTPAARPVDPAIALAWLVVPLAGGVREDSGVAGLIAGAVVFTGISKVAAAFGLPTLALAGPVAAVLLWREARA